MTDVLKHAEVVLRQEQDTATTLYPQQMEKIVLAPHLSQQDAILRNVVSIHSVFQSQQMQCSKMRSKKEMDSYSDR